MAVAWLALAAPLAGAPVRRRRSCSANAPRAPGPQAKRKASELQAETLSLRKDLGELQDKYQQKSK